MCNKITKIAKQNSYQWVGICSHGAAHIFWRTTHVCLPFKALEHIMNQALIGRLPLESYQDQYLLWINNTAIKLQKEDVKDILTLFTLAAETQVTNNLPTPVSSHSNRLVH